jgi:hypothetical protein
MFFSRIIRKGTLPTMILAIVTTVLWRNNIISGIEWFAYSCTYFLGLAVGACDYSSYSIFENKDKKEESTTTTP